MTNQNKTQARVPRDPVVRARERSRAIKGSAPGRRFVICINDGGYVDDLKVRTIYQLLPDESAASSNYIRIIDETGEDYLYPAELFATIELPRELEKVLLTAN
jgi:hypothetical protein